MRRAGRIARLLNRFRRGDEGSIAAEAVIVFPMMIWALLAGYVFSDAMRVKSLNTKAAYTVADALSREGSVNQNFVDRMSELAWMLTGGRDDTALRVTVLRYETATDTYRLSWSNTKGIWFTPLTEADLNAMRDRLPVAADMDSLILVETHMVYAPVYDVGLSDTDLLTFVITRPRYSPGLCWEQTLDC
jgi:hypothetical protein